MPKIAMIGAGSIVFAKTLFMDIVATPSLCNSEFRFMSRTRPKLERLKAFADKVIKENGIGATAQITLDRREALKDADYVIVMLQIGGVDAFEKDYQIPLKHGVDQCIADTLGPGGVFRTLRTAPVMMDIAREMQELCPNAYLLNYVNPMATVCWSLGKVPGTKFVGLCHGVQTTLDLISGYVGLPKEEIDYIAAGINHMGWFLRLEHKGKDLYPRIARVLHQRKGAYRDDAAHRLLHDRKHRTPLRVPAVVSQQQVCARPLLRRAEFRRRERRVLQVVPPDRRQARKHRYARVRADKNRPSER